MRRLFLVALATLWLALTANASLSEPNFSITADSTKGWQPSQSQLAAGFLAYGNFTAAFAGADYARAYGMLSPQTRALAPYSAMQKNWKAFRDVSGSLKDRQIVHITLTSGSTKAPQTGTYFVVDESTNWQNVHMQCGFIVLYQSTPSDPFTVVRFENNYIDDISARDITKTKPKGTLHSIWAQLSAHCPNYTGQPKG